MPPVKPLIPNEVTPGYGVMKIFPPPVELLPVGSANFQSVLDWHDLVEVRGGIGGHSSFKSSCVAWIQSSP